jgi:hypothetical protein
MAATIWIRAETGLMSFTDPLPPGIAARLGKDVFRVSEDGSPWDPEKPEKPAAAAKPAVAPAKVPPAAGHA